MRIALAVVISLAAFLPSNITQPKPPSGGEGPQDSMEKRVAALLDQLRSDEIERRDAAAKALVALGEPALAFLEKAAAAPSDAEFAARLKLVMQRIWRNLPPATPADRLKLRSRRLEAALGGKTVEDAILAALAWLARHQDADGGWRVTGFTELCEKAGCPNVGSADYDTGVTALAVLAFLGAGYSPSSKEELADPSDPKKKWKPGEVVKRGLARLRVKQLKNGCVGDSDLKFIYAHAAATLALSEAAAMTGAAEDKEAARKAVDYLLDARNPLSAWRYSHRSGNSDTSVTGWCVAALHGATQAKLWAPDKDVKDAVIGWMDRVTTPPSLRAGYNGAGTGKVFVPGKNADFAHHEAMTAISILSRKLFAPDDKESEKLDDGVKLLLRDRPENKPNMIDSYYWFWASLAVHRIDGSAGEQWLKWVEASNQALLSSQFDKGCWHGSWEPGVDRWGFEGGRVAVTALNALTLLTPAR
jgi:hypothetical protein